MSGSSLPGTARRLAEGTCPRGPVVTLAQSELEYIQAIASGLPPAAKPNRKKELQAVVERQKAAATRALGWRNSLCSTRQRRLLEQQKQQQRREQELLLQDQEEAKRREQQQEQAIENAKSVALRRDENFRAFLRAQMIADTVAGQKEQQKWSLQKCALDQLRQNYLHREEEKVMKRLAEREQRDKEEKTAKNLEAQAILKQQVEERAKQRARESEAVLAEAETTKIQLHNQQQAEQEAAKAKEEESRRLYRELMRENAQLQERRKLLQAQQVAEEAAASACAAKLLGREEMIRKRREEVRALALERSQRLTAQGAAALAAAMAEEIVRQERQAAQWEADVKHAEEAKQKNRAALIQQLKESRDKQIEEKKQEKERRSREDAAYAELLRLAAAAADAEDELQQQQQRARRREVRLQQEQQAREREQFKKQERERVLRQEREANTLLHAADLMVQRFAEEATVAARAAGADWHILERARQRLLHQSTLNRPHEPACDNDDIPDALSLRVV